MSLVPLIIGEAPSQNGDPTRPLEGACGQRLADLFGMTFEDYLDSFVRTNLLLEWPGKAGKGDQFPMAEASLSASAIKIDGRTTFLLGKRVARAFGFLPQAQFLKGYTSPSGPWRMMILPHPSGINLWWNDAVNVRRAKKAARKFFRDGIA